MGTVARLPAARAEMPDAILAMMSFVVVFTLVEFAAANLLAGFPARVARADDFPAVVLTLLLPVQPGSLPVECVRPSAVQGSARPLALVPWGLGRALGLLGLVFPMVLRQGLVCH